jgi:type I restriction enzyme R subunit
MAETRRGNCAILPPGGKGGMPGTSNFGFLEGHDARLATFGAQAERYFRDDPPTAIVKLRQFAELLAKLVAAHHALYLGERETFDETLRRLSFELIVPKEAADVFHVLRKFGNAAVHDAKGGHADALASLKFARQLGVWFHRTYGRQPNFNPGPFVPPPEPVDATVGLKEEIDALRRKVAESLDAAAVARLRAEEQERARESVETRLRREAEERATWEQLAQDSETQRIEIAARLAALQAAAETGPKADILEFVQRGEQAAAKIDLDEASTRDLIDQVPRSAMGSRHKDRAAQRRCSPSQRPKHGHRRMAHSERASRLRTICRHSHSRGRRGQATPQERVCRH